MTCPGFQVGRYFPDVSGGSDGDMLDVSDSAHETCHARWTIIPSVKVIIASVPEATGAVIVVSPEVIVRAQTGLSAGVGKAYSRSPRMKPLR